MDKLERIRRLRDDYEASLDEAERLRDEYHRAIVKLHRSGMSLREIADGLGISHQRVHQIVSPHEEETPKRRKRGAIVGGTVATVAALAVLLLTFRSGPGTDTASAPRVSDEVACHARTSRAQTDILRVCTDAQLRTLISGTDCQRPPPYDLVLVGPSGVEREIAVCRTAMELDPRTGRVLATEPYLLETRIPGGPRAPHRRSRARHPAVAS